MPRAARIVMPGVPYHVTSRGNRRQDVFFSADDRKRYLHSLAKYSKHHGFDIYAYCLMTNHMHIVGLPRDDTSMAKTLHIVNLRHTQAVNRKQGWNGVLWQGRYFSTPLDEAHLWVCVRYVEQNPIRAGIVAKAEDYLWSSASCHCGLRDDPVLVSPRNRFGGKLDEWRKILSEVPKPEIVARIRRGTQTGVPCGDDSFMQKVSRFVGREIKDRPRGRPRKNQP